MNNKCEYLHELITTLSGKVVPYKLQKLSDDSNIRINQMRNLFFETLKFLQQHGAFINTIFPEYLLDFNSYRKYVKNDPNTYRLLTHNGKANKASSKP
jgi:hypothetical protein